MHIADDYFVRAQGQVLHHTQHAVGDRFSGIDDEVNRRVAVLGDDDVLALDDAAWAQQLAAEIELVPPALDIGAAEVIDEGAVTVDCAGAPGISYTTMEWGRSVLRDGNRLRLVVPGRGELGLLQSRVERGGTGRRVDVHRDRLERVYEWPQVRPPEELDADMASVLNELKYGCQEIAAEVRQRNEQIATAATKLLEERRQKIVAGRSFVGELRLPVKRREEAATRIPDLPKLNPRPRALTQAPTAKPTPALDGPTLDEFYRHILTVIRNTVVGLERSPGRFANADEEWLRDHLLVTLNTHSTEQHTASRSTAPAKPTSSSATPTTTTFIGECKWWGGKKVLLGAFEQLLGYTTWRDNRLALVLFVGAKGLTTVITTTKAEIEQRPEFLRWSSSQEPGELACQLRWEDDSREAALTAFFVHLPRARAIRRDRFPSAAVPARPD